MHHCVQLCVGPNHVYVPRSIAASFNEALKKAYAEIWPQPPLSTEMNWGRIVNKFHHSRMTDLLSRSLGRILIGGEVEGKERIAPTVVIDVEPGDALMEQ